MVAVPPSGWTADPVFVPTLLAGLAGNPIIEPVTMSQLFATFPTPARCGSRLPSGHRAPPSGLPVAAIRAQRPRVDGFASAYRGPARLPQQLDDVLLAGESADLRPAQQAAVRPARGAAVDAQLGQLPWPATRASPLRRRTGTSR